MQAHIVENEKIVNTIEVESLDVFPDLHLVDASFGGAIGWGYAGGELVPPAPDVPDIDALKLAKNEEINAWRAAANASTFPHAGKQVACDTLSRSDIDGVANNILLFDAFPEGFPGAWKATDNTMIPMPDIDAFRAMYASMTAQGAENFNHAQDLKAQLAAASAPEEIAAIQW